jgi:hypothetical protein
MTPECENCYDWSSCTKSKLRICKKWEPLPDSPFVSLLQELSSLGDDTSALDFLDDRDFPLAPNWLSFCLDYAGVEPFPKQIEHGLTFFNDRCSYCSNPDYEELYDETLGNILDNIVLLEYGKCPKCKKNRSQMVKKEQDLYWFEELVGVAGQRSGKSEEDAMLAAYVWHWYTKLPGLPSRYFGLLGSTRLHMTFTALTFDQAKKDLWDPFSSYIRDSRWFKDYHTFLDSKCAEMGIESVCKIGENHILYRHKNIQAAPASPDKRTLRGPTRFFSSVDELGWFTGGKHAVKINPDEIYTPLNNSLKTIRTAARRLRKRTKAYHVPTAYAVNISSPSSARDGIMRLLYKSKRIKTMYSFHLPTWEMNPNYTREDFDDDFEKDPIAARRDFGAMPPLSSSPFLSDPNLLRGRIKKSKKNCLRYTLVEVKNSAGGRYISAILKAIRPVRRPMLLGIDAGYSGNHFGIILTSYDNAGNVVLEGVAEVKPLPGRPVHFNHVYKKLILPILKTQDIIMVLIDRWQSIAIQSRIEDELDIECVRHSLKYAELELVRSFILGEKVLFPEPEVDSWDDIVKGVEDYEEFFLGRPISHFLLQLVTVQDSGRRIEKSEDVEDDLFRAYALCVRFIQDEDIRIRLMTFGDSLPYGERSVVGICQQYSSGMRTSAGGGGSGGRIGRGSSAVKSSSGVTVRLSGTKYDSRR